MNLRISTPEQEGIFQESKWLKFQILCDAEELSQFFARFPAAALFPMSGICDGQAVSHALFLEKWGSWIQGLQERKVPPSEELRTLLAAVLTDDAKALWLQEVSNKGFLLKCSKPVLHLQAHSFTYSSEDKLFRPMSMGRESLFWGLQFSWPQIYQDPKSLQFCETGRLPLFDAVRQWVRDISRPTPFLVDGEKIISPIRLGKNCFSWIHRHPQLKQIQVFA